MSIRELLDLMETQNSRTAQLEANREAVLERPDGSIHRTSQRVSGAYLDHLLSEILPVEAKSGFAMGVPTSFSLSHGGHTLNITAARQGSRARMTITKAINPPTLQLLMEEPIESKPDLQPAQMQNHAVGVQENGNAETPVVTERKVPASSSRRTTAYATEVSLLWSTIGGLVLTGIFFLLVAAFARNTYLGNIFLNRGWVTELEAGLAAWSICFMIMKVYQLRQQEQFAKGLPVEVTSTLNTCNGVSTTIDRIERSGEDIRQSVLYRRIHQALTHFGRNSSRDAVADLLNSQSALDTGRTENTYSTLRVIIWAIPIIGFIGTVVGLGGAVGGFSSSLPHATDFSQLKTMLAGVTAGLSVAFDATFIALMISLLLMFPASALEKREQNLLANVDEYCQNELLAALPANSTAVHQDMAPSYEIQQLLEKMLQTQQERFIDWWKTVNNEIAGQMKAVTHGTLTASQQILASTDQLQATVASATRDAQNIPIHLQEGARHVAETARMLAEAKVSAEGIAIAASSAEQCMRSIPMVMEQSLQHAAGVEQAYAQALTHAHGCSEESLKVQNHMVDANTAVAGLKEDLAQAMESVYSVYTSKVQQEASALKNHAAVLGKAAEQVQNFAENMSQLAGVNGHSRKDGWQ